MADNKTYYYMKINKDFFDDDTVKYLEEQEHGKDFIILYLKLCLKSLEDEGLLIRYVGTKLIPYDTAAIAKMTNTDIVIVEKAMKIFEEIELIEKKETGELFMSQIQEMIGTDTYEARKKRKQRAKDKAQGDNVPQVSPNSPQDVPEYKSKSKSIELEKEKEVEVDKEQNQPTTTPPTFNQEFVNLYKSFEAETGKALSPIQMQELQYMLEDFSPELIHEALKEAVSQGKANFAYIKAILNRWKQDNLLTAELVRNSKAAREAKKQQNNSKPEPQTREEWLANWSEENPF
ncbi:DnaD domain protein [Streptococcus dysgalactiae]|uniref:DnaD domain protein n=1 Tax=Streptococcus dysgalactiae TaxID=1334 RepID=UPI00194DFD0B|nr:DnaD domain protein [Streptococcus dysgalactiae subsp. equisimilis]